MGGILLLLFLLLSLSCVVVAVVVLNEGLVIGRHEGGVLNEGLVIGSVVVVRSMDGGDGWKDALLWRERKFICERKFPFSAGNFFPDTGNGQLF